MMLNSRPIAAMMFLAAVGAAGAAEWTAPVDVFHDVNKAISYRAKVSSGYLIVQATVEPGWHTFCMDNAQRANEKLAGRQSLGGDLPTKITVSGGLEVEGAWHQTGPKEFSKPELLWFSWGYDGQALFVAKVRQTGPGPAQVGIRGQACTDKVCKGIDVEIAVPLTAGGAKPEQSEVDLKSLTPVRQ